MGHKNKQKFTTFFLFILILALTFGIFTILKSNLNTQNERESTEEVKGNAKSVDCATIQPLVQSVIDSSSLPRKWYLKDGIAGTSQSDILLEIVNSSVQETDLEFFSLKYAVDFEENSKEMEYSKAEKKWLGKIDISNLEPGEHLIKIYPDINGCNFTYARELPFTLSYPVFVTWTLDWEGTDVKNSNLDSIVEISSKYEIPVTHFFNPYIYYSTPESRSKYVTDWIINRRNLGDSIGLHLHMYEKYVNTAGVTPIDVRWGYNGYGKGYDVPTLEYSYSDFRKILSLAKSDFQKNGLGNPILYRAGGWFADEDILRAVQDSGFIVDSSGRTSYEIGTNKVVGPWTLSTTTQPYRLNMNNQNDTQNGSSNLWEIPNNGLDSWTFDAKQMISAFTQNYSSGVSQNTKVVTYLSHIQGFEHDYPIINEVFTNISKYSFNSDSGPVVFTTIDKLPMLSENR